MEKAARTPGPTLLSTDSQNTHNSASGVDGVRDPAYNSEKQSHNGRREIRTVNVSRGSNKMN